MPDNADQGFLLAQVECTPADLGKVRSEMTGIAADLAQGKISDGDLETVRTPFLQHLAQIERTNASWASVLANASVNLDGLNEITHDQADFAALTLSDVRKAAADWLTSAPTVVTVIPKPVAAPVAASKEILNR